MPFPDLCGKIFLTNHCVAHGFVCDRGSMVRYTKETEGSPAAGRIEMSIGVVVGVAAICVMALIGVLAGVIAAVSTVSGIDTRDNEGD